MPRRGKPERGDWMDQNQFSEKKVEQLLSMASKKLGVSPDQLKSQLQQGNVHNAVQGGKVDMNRFQKIVKDPGKIQQMLDTPAAKQLLKQLSEEK